MTQMSFSVNLILVFLWLEFNYRLMVSSFQLQEYQTDMWRCRFDTPGKLIPAHSAGAHTARGLCVAPGRCVGAELTASGPPTAQGH